MGRHPLPIANASLLRQATVASVTTALLLVAGKFTAWRLTGSLSVLASMIDSCLDAAASIITLAAVAYSLRAADAQHTFGHGKAESLAGLAQSLCIAFSALFLIVQAAGRLLAPPPLAAINAGLAVMAAAMAITLLLLLFQRRVVRKTGSLAIRADSLHYASDLLTNLATMAALLLARAGWPLADPLLALAIAGYIIYGAGTIACEAAQHLMDRELPDGIRQEILALALANPQVVGVHDLRTRQSGQVKVIQLHLVLEDRLPLHAAHAVAKEVEGRIAVAFPGTDIIIHQDPASCCRPPIPAENLP